MKWIKQGNAPDYRFSLANERTFLAWIRTSLAFLAAAIGLDQLAPNLASPAIREMLSLALCLFAALIALYAYLRWVANEKAMRQNTDLPYTKILRLVSIFMTLIACAIILMISNAI
ncbi:DUF202 domain-containing protein [Vibrio sp. 1-Bac 57]|uniref:YidH family protein n=1 Tax=Psychromonas sp. SA13A TaxID=2686346 RepID=UPI00140CD9A4|nr:DUF202 domain-containing protein [Psychromonas sp. SA13A]